MTASVTLTNGSVSLVPADMTFVGCDRSQCPVPPQVAVLMNTGPTALSISGVTIGGTNAADFAESNTCGKTLAAAASCNISVTYTSKSRGTHTAVLSIADKSPDSPQQLSLTGINKARPGAALQSALRDQSMAAVPRPTGNSRVGTRLMHWVDDSRADPYRADGTKRELMVRFWYPSSGDTACTPADYTSVGVLSQFSQLLLTTLPQISTNSCLNAPVATGTHPVVVVTPGFTGTFTDYTFLTEDLASRGYVVVAVDHTYEATAVEFPDGRVEQGVFGSYLTQYTRSDPQALAFAVSVRLADLRFVVNELMTLNGASDPAFAGKLDLARIALAGHSLGGLTTLRGVEKDARFRAGISLDGLLLDRLTPPTTTPVLLIRAGSDPWNENDCHLWSALRGVHAAVNLNGAEHVALSDAIWLGRGAIATGPMGIEKTIAAIRETSAAFLDAAFRGASLDGPAFRSLMKDPNAIVTLQSQSPCRGP
jgi:predicted dienelactone hydrolase